MNERRPTEKRRLFLGDLTSPVPPLDPDPLHVEPVDDLRFGARARIRAVALRLRELAGNHWPLLAAAAALVIVGWTLPSTDRFGFIVGMAVGIPWALLVLGPPRGDER